MSDYKERIDRIVGRKYSNLFFYYFIDIYHCKIISKISDPLNDYLHKYENKGESLWMKIYKSIITYSKDHVPLLISKYFYYVADKEYKYIYMQSKKYTQYPNDFIDLYLEKMEKYHEKKLRENQLAHNHHNMNRHSNIINLRSFFAKRSLRSKKFSLRDLGKESKRTNENSDSSGKDELIKSKKRIKTEIQLQIHQLKLDSIREIQEMNKFQNKQRKKYGNIKSRFMEIYKEQKDFYNYLNTESMEKKINHHSNKNNLKNNSIMTLPKMNKSQQNLKYASDISKFILANMNQISYIKKNSYDPDKFYLNFLYKEKKKNLHDIKYIKTQINKDKESRKISKYQDRNKMNLFMNSNSINNNKNINQKFFSGKKNKNKKESLKLKITNNWNFKLSDKYNIRSKSGANYQKQDTEKLIEQIERKKNKKLFNDLMKSKDNKDSYRTTLFRLFEQL